MLGPAAKTGRVSTFRQMRVAQKSRGFLGIFGAPGRSRAGDPRRNIETNLEATQKSCGYIVGKKLDLVGLFAAGPSNT